MKRFLVLALALSAVAGCKTVSAPTPVAPGYLNATDQQLGQTLRGARDFYRTIQCETQGQNFQELTDTCVPDTTIQKLTLTPTEKTSFTVLAASINSAEVVYQQYHLGQATLAQVQTAVQTVTQQQSALQSTLTGGK